MFAWLISLVSLSSCKSLDIAGNYSYTKEEMSEKHRNEIVMTYNGNINGMPYKAKQKINHDPLYPDKPAYYEASYELWFW
jgi:hypothetical protein